MELAPFRVKIGPPIPGEPDRRPHFFQDFKIIIQTSFGNSDLLSAVGRCARAFVGDKVIQADQPVK